MAKLHTTRQQGSVETFNYFGKTFASKIVKPQDNSKNDKSVSVSDDIPKEDSSKQVSKRKANIASGTAKWKTPKSYNEIFLEPSHVRASALLYEITERTNQLAQPRVRCEGQTVQQHNRSNASLIPRASPRIIELSKPRVVYRHPSKPRGYVTPAALTAVATQRIIELSKPKRKRRLKVSNRRKSKSHKDRTRNWTGNERYEFLQCIRSTVCIKINSCYSSYVRHVKKKPDYKSSTFQRRNDRRMRNKCKQCRLKTSNSERTVIMVGLNLKDSKKNRRQS